MATRTRRISKTTNGNTTKTRPPQLPADARVRVIGERGIINASDFADYMSAVMSDLVSGAITPQVANAACNAGGKLLKVMEMRMKYGQQHVKNVTPERPQLGDFKF